jgi:hypothetical protein
LTVKIALGFKAHSGWAALVGIGRQGKERQVADRRRIELIESGTAEWAKQPYHAAEELNPTRARDLVKRSIEAARRRAELEIQQAVERLVKESHEVTACAVLVGDPMPNWSVAEIVAVHFRMHKAEGVLFREALIHGANACSLRVVEVPEKELTDYAARTLATSAASLAKQIAVIGKSVGPPWGKDQKDAALAAMVALEGRKIKA